MHPYLNLAPLCLGIMIHLLITWSHTVFSHLTPSSVGTWDAPWWAAVQQSSSPSSPVQGSCVALTKHCAAWNGDNHFFLVCFSEAWVAGKPKHFTDTSKVIFRAPLWQKALSHFRGMAEACAGLLSAAIYTWIWPLALPEVFGLTSAVQAEK